MKTILIYLSFLMLITSCSNSYNISKEYNNNDLKQKNLYLIPTGHHYPQSNFDTLSIKRHKLYNLVNSEACTTLSKQENLKMQFEGLVRNPPRNKKFYTYKEFNINGSNIHFLIPKNEVFENEQDSVPFLLLLQYPKIQLKGYSDGYKIAIPLLGDPIITDILLYSLAYKTGTRYMSSTNQGSNYFYLEYTSYYVMWDCKLDKAISYGAVKKDYEPKHPHESSNIFLDETELARIKKDVIEQSINTILINSQFIKEDAITSSPKSRSKFMR